MAKIWKILNRPQGFALDAGINQERVLFCRDELIVLLGAWDGKTGLG